MFHGHETCNESRFCDFLLQIHPIWPFLFCCPHKKFTFGHSESSRNFEFWGSSPWKQLTRALFLSMVRLHLQLPALEWPEKLEMVDQEHPPKNSVNCELRLRCLSIEYYISCRAMLCIHLILRHMFSKAFFGILQLLNQPRFSSCSFHAWSSNGWAFWTESSLPKIRLQDESSSHSTWTTNHLWDE